MTMQIALWRTWKSSGRNRLLVGGNQNPSYYNYKKYCEFVVYLYDVGDEILGN